MTATFELATDPPGVAPRLPTPVAPLAVTTLDALAHLAATAGARSVTLAAHPCDDATDHAARGAGWEPTRHQLQLRCGLPLAHPATLEVALRTFDPSTDVEPWLGVNHRAFAWHPDQAHWSVADLHQRMQEPWFDPEGFLVHDTDGVLDGFCWTKVHPAAAGEPALGEIFVIGVDPSAHGRGLGRALVVAGLTYLHEQRGVDTGMLYVEADNVAARALYDSLGFVVHEHHRWYRRSLA
jgi:mycothiol synthase